MSGLVVHVPLIRNRLAITTVTESLVSDVIDVLRKELHRSINKHELRSTLVGRLEALGRLPVLPVRAPMRVQRRVALAQEKDLSPIPTLG